MLATRGPEFYSQLRIFAGILKKNHLGILKINAEVIDFSIYVFARILRTYRCSRIHNLRFLTPISWGFLGAWEESHETSRSIS